MIFQRAIESKEYMANSKAMLSKLRSLKKSLAISSVLTLITGLILFLLPTQSIAANLDISAFTVKTNPDGTQDYSLSLQVVILMVILTINLSNDDLLYTYCHCACNFASGHRFTDLTIKSGVNWYCLFYDHFCDDSCF